MEEYKAILKLINEKLEENEMLLECYRNENEKLKQENEKLRKGDCKND